MCYAMLNLLKMGKKILSANNRGSIGITVLGCCFILTTLLNILYLMEHEVHKLIVDAELHNNLKYVNEYYLISASKILNNEEAIDKVFLCDNNVYTISTVKEDNISCDISGIKNNNIVLLRGEAKEKNTVNRIYLELVKQGDKYVPRYWNY